MRIAPERLAQLANAEWVDVAQAQAAEPPSADHRLP